MFMASTMQPDRPRRKKRASPCQDAILEFMVDFKRDPDNDGNSPTYGEIADALGISTQTAYEACLRMVGHGVLRFNRNRKLVVGGKWIPPE